jgi:transposase-like protein
MTESQKSRRYSPEVRERAVRMVLEHQHEYDGSQAAPRMPGPLVA